MNVRTSFKGYDNNKMKLFDHIFTTSSETTLSTSTKLSCALCKDYFVSPWDLMVHVQAAHMINIYELGFDATNNNHVNNNNNNNTNISGSNDASPLNKLNGNVDIAETHSDLDENETQLISTSNVSNSYRIKYLKKENTI